MSPSAIVALANTIGRPKGVRCVYAWDTTRRVFAYRFYRAHAFLGSTTKAEQVVHKMEKFTCAK